MGAIPIQASERLAAKPLRLDRAGDVGWEVAQNVWARSDEEKAWAEQSARTSLWPDEFEDTAEGAYRFVLAQYTWNEAEGEVQRMPDKEFLEEYTHEWHGCLKAGQLCATEKCRRMIISWTARSLELHQMGHRRTDCILAGEDFEAAAKHVWRLKFLYNGLQERYPKWNLPKHIELKYEGDRKLKAFGLPNGSLTTYANGQANGLQGDGVKIITMEEFGLYRYAASMLAQAKIITKGSAKATGGFVNIITNTSLNYDWQKVKAGAIRVQD